MESLTGNNTGTPAPKRSLRLPGLSAEQAQLTLARTLPLIVLTLGLLFIGGSLLLTLRHLNAALSLASQPHPSVTASNSETPNFEEQKNNLPLIDLQNLQSPF